MYQILIGLYIYFSAASASAQVTLSNSQNSVGNVGISGIWILSNLCYAGMRAQNHPSFGWRIASFLLGMPGTLITYFVVIEGSEEAYGVHLPKKS